MDPARISLLNAALATHWAIREEAFQEILSFLQGDYNPTRLAQVMHPNDFQKFIVNGQFNPEAIQKQEDDTLPGSYRSEIRRNVAIVPLRGPIFPRANLMTMSGGTSVTSLAHDLNLALSNDNVDTIIINVDSPGGEITGIDDFSQMILKGRSNGKKIVSYVYGQDASAALWITSQTSKIYMSKTAQIGSIGVVAGYTLREKADEKSGIQRVEIVSSQSPKKRINPTTPEGRDHIQKTVNDLADIFISRVAAGRRVSAEDVVSKFGEGGMILADQAISVGLADSISTLEDIIESNIKSNSFYYGGIMNLTVAQVKAENPDVYTSILNEGKLLGKTEAETALAGAKDAALAEGKKLGAEAENARIKGIESLAIPGATESLKIINEKKFIMTETKETVCVALHEDQARRAEALGKGRTASGQKVAEQSAGIGAQVPLSTADEAEEQAALDAMIQGANASSNKTVK